MSNKKLNNHILSNDYGQSIFYYTNTARTGLRLLLSSLPGKRIRIGVQVFTCHTVFQAIKRAGHEIVFLDINNEFQLDLKYLNEHRDMIDVLIITHTFGYPEQFDEIREIFGNKIIIEDCAHAFLSSYKGRLCGTLGDASIFSFGLGKFPPIGAGGGVLLSNPEKFPRFSNLYDELTKEIFISSVINWFKILSYSLLMHRLLYGLITFKLGKQLDSKFDFTNKFSFHESMGFPFCKKLLQSHYPFFLEVKNKNLSNYELISSRCEINSIQINNGTTPNYYIVPISFRKRDELYHYLLKNKIEAGRHFEDSIKWAKEFGYKNDCPGAEVLSKRVLTIPLHNSVTKRDINKMVKLLTIYSKSL